MTDKQKNEDKGNSARLGHIEERERERGSGLLLRYGVYY